MARVSTCDQCTEESRSLPIGREHFQALIKMLVDKHITVDP